MNRYVEKVKTKSDGQLREIVQHRIKYVEDLVVAASEELKSRGEDVNVESIQKEIEEKKERKAATKDSKKKPPIPLQPKLAVILILLSAALVIAVPLVYGVSIILGSLSLIALFLIIFAILLFNGSNTTRWIWTVLIGLGMINFLSNSVLSSYIDVIALLQFFIQGTATVLLHTKQSRDWFTNKITDEEEEFIF